MFFAALEERKLREVGVLCPTTEEFNLYFVLSLGFARDFYGVPKNIARLIKLMNVFFKLVNWTEFSPGFLHNNLSKSPLINYHFFKNLYNIIFWNKAFFFNFCFISAHKIRLTSLYLPKGLS